MKTLEQLVRELIDMLETEEESDSGSVFHPTTIRSCRIQHTMKLNEIMPQITTLVKPKVYTKEEIDEIVSKTHYP